MDKVIIDNNEETIKISDNIGLGGVTLDRKPSFTGVKKAWTPNKPSFTGNGNVPKKPIFKKPPVFNDTSFVNFANQEKKAHNEPPEIHEDDEENNESESENDSQNEDSIAEFGNDEQEEDTIPSQGYKTIEDEKQDILYKFHRLDGRGIKTSKKFTMYSDIREMRMELAKLRKDSEMNSNIKFSKRLLVAFVSGSEFLNKRYDPVGMELDGWSESVMTNVNDGEYDTIMERLSEKYSGKVQSPPELDLMIALGSSALMFHITSSMFKRGPNNIPNNVNMGPMTDAVKNAFENMNKKRQEPADEPNYNSETRDMRGPSVDLSHFGSMFGNTMNQQSENDYTSEILPYPQATKQHKPPPSVISTDQSEDTKNVTFETQGGTKRRGRKPKIIATKENTINI